MCRKKDKIVNQIDYLSCQQWKNTKQIERLAKELQFVHRDLTKLPRAEGLNISLNGATFAPFIKLLEQIKSDLKSKAGAFSESIDSRSVSKFLTRLISTLIAIRDSKNIGSITIHLLALLNDYFPCETVVARIMGWIATLVEDLFSYVKPLAYRAEGLSVEAFEVSKYWSTFSSLFDKLDDRRMRMIGDFFLKVQAQLVLSREVCAIKFSDLDLDTAKEKFWEFIKLKDGFDNIFECFDATLLFISSNWEKLTSGDWSSFWLGREEAEVFETKVQTLQNAFSPYKVEDFETLNKQYSLTEASFEADVEKILVDGKKLVVACTSTQQRITVERYLKGINDIHRFIIKKRAEKPYKPDPYGLKVIGKSGVGKSELSSHLERAILLGVGVPIEEQKGRIASVNMGEKKFESTIEPHHYHYTCDDVGQGDYDASRLFNYANPMMRPLAKAGIDEKGEAYPMNKSLMVTSNFAGLKLKGKDVLEEAGLRRFHLNADIRVREEFRNDIGGLNKESPHLDRSKAFDFGIYDIRLFRFRRYSPQDPDNFDAYVDEKFLLGENEDGEEIFQTKTYKCYEEIPRSEWALLNGKTTTPEDGKDFALFLKFLRQDAEEKYSAAVKKFEAKKNSVLSLCPSCNTDSELCVCLCREAENSTLSKLTTRSTEFLVTTSNLVSHNFWSMNYNIEFCRALWSEIKIVSPLLSKRGLIGSLGLLGFVQARDIQTKSHWRTGAFTATVCTLPVIGLYRVKRKAVEALRQRRTVLADLCEDTRDLMRKHGSKIVPALGTVLVASGLIRLWYTSYIAENNTILFDNPDVRNSIAKSSNFSAPAHVISSNRKLDNGYIHIEPTLGEKSRTTTGADLHAVTDKLQRIVLVKTGDKVAECKGIVVAGNILLTVNHQVPEDRFSIETHLYPGVSGSRTKDVNLGSRHVYRIPERDICFVHLPSCPAGRDLSAYFPDCYRDEAQRPTRMFTKTMDRDFISFQAMKTLDIRDNAKYILPNGRIKIMSFGYKYLLQHQSFRGMCGSLLVDRERAIIYGMHVAGTGEIGDASLATPVFKTDIEDARASLIINSPHLIHGDVGEIRVNRCGKAENTLVNAPPLFMNEGKMGSASTCTYFGSLRVHGMVPRATARSPYARPLYLETVERLWGKSKHRPPTNPNSPAKACKTLDKLVNPVQGYDHEALEMAGSDYRNQLIDCMDENPEESRLLRTYTLQEAMDGTGMFGQGGMPNDTSAGFPWNCSKSKLLERDPFDEALPLIPRKFKDDSGVYEECQRIWDCWGRGERSESVFKSSSKVNELLDNKKAVDKVRKFFGSNTAFHLCQSRLCNGLVTWMRKFWRESECLNGINPTSSEWEEFHDYLTTFGDQNMFAGDFSGFDTRMSQQVSSLFFKIITDLYEKAGFMPAEDLLRLRTCLSEIANPLVLFESDLFSFANMTPSGNKITVQGNSGENSIMIRYVFFRLWKKHRKGFFHRTPPKFSDVCKLGTFGDDNAGGVSDDVVDFFGHKTIQEEFSTIEIDFTMADKKSESIMHIPISEISFLKRNFRLHEDLECIVAPIELDSIRKKFYYCKKTSECPLSVPQQFAEHYESAIRECFLYGREFFDKFNDDIRTIVNEHPELNGYVMFENYDLFLDRVRPDYFNHSMKQIEICAGESNITVPSETDWNSYRAESNITEISEYLAFKYLDEKYCNFSTDIEPCVLESIYPMPEDFWEYNITHPYEKYMDRITLVLLYSLMVAKFMGYIKIKLNPNFRPINFLKWSIFFMFGSCSPARFTFMLILFVLQERTVPLVVKNFSDYSCLVSFYVTHLGYVIEQIKSVDGQVESVMIQRKFQTGTLELVMTPGCWVYEGEYDTYTFPLIGPKPKGY